MSGTPPQAGFDVVKEIRWLGKDRICQFHLKDNPHYLGEGTISFPQVIEAIRDIGFTGAANLETDTHAGIHGRGGHAQEPGLHPPGDGLAGGGARLNAPRHRPVGAANVDEPRR